MFFAKKGKKPDVFQQTARVLWRADNRRISPAYSDGLKIET